MMQPTTPRLRPKIQRNEVSSMKIAASERFLWFILCLTAAASAVAEEPRELLARMNEALTSRNYDGIFAHQQGRKVEMLRIIHRVQDGRTMERLASLDGSGREFVRAGNELTCYLPDKRTVLVERLAGERPLLGNFPKFDESSTAFYDVEEIKRTRFLRRDTRVIAVNPRDEFRYGYRLWIDEETAMPLKTQLCDGRGRVIESLLVADLKMPKMIPDTAFKPDVSTEGFQWLRTERESTKDSSGNGALWSALKLPPGFRMTVRSTQVMPGQSSPVMHLVFSDGLASVSVFVEQASKAAGGAPAAPSSVQVGSSSAFSTEIGGRKVTALGDVPQVTVRTIANSMTPGGVPVPGTESAETRKPAESARTPMLPPPPALSLGSPPRR
jgi:sigma-E factor negative regulatory protein RseB